MSHFSEVRLCTRCVLPVICEKLRDKWTARPRMLALEESSHSGVKVQYEYGPYKRMRSWAKPYWPNIDTSLTPTCVVSPHFLIFGSHSTESSKYLWTNCNVLFFLCRSVDRRRRRRTCQNREDWRRRRKTKSEIWRPNCLLFLVPPMKILPYC